MFILLIFSLLLVGLKAHDNGSGNVVRNLVGEPDYRQVHLRWETDVNSIPENGYNIRYCELQSWGAQRCRSLHISTTATPNERDSKSWNNNNNQNGNALDEKSSYRIFTAEVKGLRMATTYSFEIAPAVAEKENKKTRQDRANDKDENVIVVPTKGFSAKATLCLPQVSEIEVSTGPYFAGRIGVEAADGERCAIDGQPKSPQDVYTLRINHTKCGSQVNSTTVATFVIVQENLPILTHSTRRFLVLCSYQPETLTVRAGINLPTGLLQQNGASTTAPTAKVGRGQVQASPYEEVNDNNALNNSGNRRARKLRTGRRLQQPEALVKTSEVTGKNEEVVESTNIVAIFVVTLLIIAGIIYIVGMAIRVSNRKLLDNLDNISIASEISVSSTYSTTTNIESESEDKARRSFNSHRRFDFIN